MKYSGWFICDDHLILGVRKSETLLKRTKKGIPSGALDLGSEKNAENELAAMRRWGHWPLFAPNARVERIEWS